MATYRLQINGRAHQVEGEADDSLLSVLRYELGLPGAKYGCGEGRCGACTVLIDGAATRSCTAGIGTLAGKSITTIEALSQGEPLHPVQQAFLDAEAFQCGYCTPGMVMAVVSLLNRNPAPTEQEIAKTLDTNVCRCGTFPRVVKAVHLAAQRMRSTSSAGVRR